MAAPYGGATFRCARDTVRLDEASAPDRMIHA
jgi:hypothetical protein